jgi:paraquat-inducible protein A
MGALTGWLRLVRPEEMATSTQSLLGGIRLLWMDGNPLLACMLAAFCLILPLAKFLILWGECFKMPLGDSLWGRFCRATAPYAMVEVFVLALLVMVIKGLPGGSLIVIQAGAWCFTGSVLLSLFAAQLLKPAKIS